MSAGCPVAEHLKTDNRLLQPQRNVDTYVVDAHELSPIPSHSNATSNRQLKPQRAHPTKRRLEVDNPGHTERG